jgi:Skp family chaperone for outer membrane proteins
LEQIVMKSKSGIIVVGALALALVAGVTRQVVHAQSSAAPAPAAAKIAVVDMIGVVDKLMSQGAFRTARDQFDTGQMAAQEKIKAEYTTITADVTARLEAAKTDDEKAKINEEKDSKLGELQARYQNMQGETDKFTVNMLADAFDLATETTGRIAKGLGYTHVLTSRSGPIPRDRNSQLAFQEILLRHVAIHPEGDDLTKIVEKELKLDEIAPVGPAPAPGAVPASDAKPDAPKAPDAPAAPK